jgi:hypothetical protein
MPEEAPMKLRNIYSIGEIIHAPWGYDDEGNPMGPNESRIEHDIDNSEALYETAQVVQNLGGR